MSKQKYSKDEGVEELYMKILSIEDFVNDIKTANNILMSYSAEHSAEASLIAHFIDKQLKEIFKILLK